MSEAARQDPWADRERPDGLIRKVGEAAALVEQLRAAQARDARTRATLAYAAVTALGREAGLRARLRGMMIEAARKPRRIRGRWLRRAAWRLRPLFLRLGAPGQTLFVLISSIWRPGQARAGGLFAIAAYLSRKADPTAAPSSLFDQGQYLALYPDVAATGMSPLLHYLVAGQREGRSPHPLFDAAFYAERNAAEIAATRLWPLAHFVTVGADALRDPHPLFDMAHYASHGAQPAAGETLVSHYLREGWRQGLSPHPLFDPAWYRSQMGEAEPQTPELVHYLTQGAAAGLSPHPLFDPAWYLTQAPQAQRPGSDPLTHYLRVGAAHGLSPSAWFDPRHYAARRGQVLARDANPLADYLLQGAWTVGEPAPGFATAAYLAAHPELVADGETPLGHWARVATERRRAD